MSDTNSPKTQNKTQETSTLEPTQQLQSHANKDKILQINSPSPETEVRKNAAHFNINRYKPSHQSNVLTTTETLELCRKAQKNCHD
jgi:hypothetical protein